MKKMVIVISSIGIICFCIAIIVIQNSRTDSIDDTSIIGSTQKQIFSNVSLNMINKESAEQTYSYYESVLAESGLSDDIIIATVNGWPITLNEVTFRLGLMESTMLEANYEKMFNKLIEEKVIISNIYNDVTLPNKEEIEQDVASQKEILVNDSDIFYDALQYFGLSEENYWSVYAPYNAFRLLCMDKYEMNILNNIEEQNPRMNKMDYLHDAIINDKKQAKIKMVTTINSLLCKIDLENSYLYVKM